MSKRIFKRLLIASLTLSMGISALAQDGASSGSSPYTIFGIGDLATQGSAFTKSMGGIGLATRNRRIINFTNPAAVTARDTLSFMMDLGLTSENKLFTQGGAKSADNTFNIFNIGISLPIYKTLAIQASLSPMSSVDYDFSQLETSKQLIAASGGDISYLSYGSGGLYQLSGALGFKPMRNLSVGLEGIYYFGNIDKTTEMAFASSVNKAVSSGYQLELSSFTGKIGLQYEKKLAGDLSLNLGATYRAASRLHGYVTDYEYASVSSVTDTVRHNVDTLGRSAARIADEIGIGIALKKGDKWALEMNYLTSGWNSSKMGRANGFANVGTSVFSTTRSQSLRAGVEYIPNRNDIRYYYRRCSYRAGAYFDQAYYKLDGNSVNSYGLTFGVTLPVYMLHNGLTIGVDLGQKGSTKGNMTRETYAKFMIGINLHDIWFQKIRYD